MKSTIQKRLAAKLTKRSRKKVRLDPARLDEIKEAITRADVRALINDNAITLKKAKGVSKGRAKKNKQQKVKGRKKGQGSRKGKINARFSKKRTWINKVRSQRKFLKELKDNKKITNEIYNDLYGKSKGGFFRSKRHIKLYLTEHKIIKE